MIPLPYPYNRKILAPSDLILLRSHPAIFPRSSPRAHALPITSALNPLSPLIILVLDFRSPGAVLNKLFRENNVCPGGQRDVGAWFLRGRVKPWRKKPSAGSGGENGWPTFWWIILLICGGIKKVRIKDAMSVWCKIILCVRCKLVCL